MRVHLIKHSETLPITANKNYIEQQLEHIYGYSVQFTWTSTTADATVKLQASNNNTHWSDIDQATSAILDDSGSVVFNVSDAMYKYFRPVIVWNSGSVTTLDIVIYIKGP